MFLPKDPYLELGHQYIETDRCIIIPFSSDGRIDIGEFGREFCKVNKNFLVTPFLPNHEEEIEFIKHIERAIGNTERFDNFIINKLSGELIGAIGIIPKAYQASIGLWVRESEQRKGYGTEAYGAMLNWAHEHTDYTFLKHTINMENEPAGRLVLKFGGKLQKKKIDREHLTFHVPL